MRVKAGIDVLLRSPGEHLGGSKVGLITNPTGVTGDLVSTIDALNGHPMVNLKAVFGPEHGARGDIQDGLPVESRVDAATGLPVYSLYGDVRKPTPEMLEEVDALVFDIQDAGARFYTYASTLTHALEAAAENGVSLAVLDRPNPVNGVDVEGGILKPGFASFVGLHPIPIRHGLTIGELARLANEDIGAELQVVTMEGWERGMWFDETRLPWVQPSPNLPTPDTATVYPGTCLFEGVNVSEGRGTTRPFEYIGTPWIDGAMWAKALNGLGLGGVRFRACHFTPTFDKYHGEACRGVQVHVTDRDAYRPVETGLHMLSTALGLWPHEFQWLPPRDDGRRHFDLLAGSDKIRADLGRGEAVEEIVDGWRDGLEAYVERSEEFLLYRTEGV